jgi:enamine deaminase RidA (YjgF/YER057c/UK114 family)
MTQPTDIQVFGNPPPHAHYVPALGYSGLVFCSGQLPRLPDGTHTADRGFEEQVRLTLDNLDRVLALAGTSRDRVLHITAFLVSIDNWDAFNAAFAEFFGDWRPTRTVVPVPNLHFGYLVEIEAVAAAPVE